MRRPTVRIVEGDPTRAGGPAAMSVGSVPDEPYGLSGTTVVAVVDCATTSCATLRLLARGADAVVRVDLPDRGEFLDAVGRIADVRTGSPLELDGDQRALLDLLAGGHTAVQAARQIGVSLRTAHRRLSEARAALGATCNAEAIARLDTPRPADR